MARKIPNRDIAPLLAAADDWIGSCLIEDGAVFSSEKLWTLENVQSVHSAFVENPDFGEDDFLTKLLRQMGSAPAPTQALMSEMLWALLLFPSNVKASTKRRQFLSVRSLSLNDVPTEHKLLSDDVLQGVGSGGPGFNNYRPKEMEYLIALTLELKRRSKDDRKKIFATYDVFVAWIGGVPREGFRQFRHMLRYFAFPDKVERMSSNRDRKEILDAFKVASKHETANWTDRQLDEALLELRARLQPLSTSSTFDFYLPEIKEQWKRNRKVRTLSGDVTVVVPAGVEESESDDVADAEAAVPETGGDLRQSLHIQAKLARIGKTMGFKVWLPAGDRARVSEVLSIDDRGALIDQLPLNYDDTTIDTVKQIDVLWLKQRSIVRAFEVEHTTAVYSGLLRMADLLALQPNMNIRLHIVAPDERRDKFFREMQRPIFSYLEGGPLASRCTFISYESVDDILNLEHLAEMKESIVSRYEESPETDN